MGEENTISIMGSEGSLQNEEEQINTEQTATEKGPHVEREALSKAASLLETNRCLSTEHEAALQFAASLLSHPAGLPSQNSVDGVKKREISNAVDSNIPLGVKDAWLALLQNSELDTVEKGNVKNVSANSSDSSFEYPLPKGQLAKSAKVVALSTALRRSAEVAQLLLSKRKDDALMCVQALQCVASGKVESTAEHQEWFLQEFLEKVKNIREYHAKHPSDQTMKEETDLINQYSIYDMMEDGAGAELGIKHHSKKRKLGNAVADGYDLYSVLQVPLNKIKSGLMFSAEEVMGKYLDLHSCHQTFLELSCGKIEQENGKEKVSYSDFVTYLASGLHNSKLLGEKDKLAQRKKYVRFLNQLNSYLVDYLQRVSPLLDLQKEVVLPSLQDFETEWGIKGGVEGWENKPEEKVLAKTNILGSENETDSKSSSLLDLNQYQSVEELVDTVSADKIKVELARLGMKCGGTPLERAKRLWCTKDKSIDELPAKLFVNKKGKGNKNGTAKAESIELKQQSTHLRRVDIARLEFTVGALLDQLRPTLDATTRRAERRLTQTVNEKEREMEEEISGEYEDGGGEAVEDEGRDSDDSDDDDAPIYNPKGVPLGWDGKPIPYWLFKLHGLNHFYPCEICGNESYRGRHNFEKHFAEAKHSYGMKCLGIPNTNHFHGVTKIEDAQNLWLKLQENVNKDIFDASKEEEYEDSHGNVLSRSTYEDLARQGLL
jgi:Splicing factor 3a, subunit 3